MSYDIILSAGGSITIADNSVDNTQTSINLVGNNYLDYSAPIGESLAWLTENFANTSAPSNPLVGQLWYSTTTNNINVYNGTSWDEISTTVDDDLAAHLSDPSAHTKSQVGLSNVANNLQLIASNNLSDLPSNSLSRTNLNVYSKPEVDALLSSQMNVVVVSGNYNASNFDLVVQTDSSTSRTITLPPSPDTGDIVRVYNTSSRTDHVVDRNGENIMGLAEDMIIDLTNFVASLAYVDSTRGWAIL